MFILCYLIGRFLQKTAIAENDLAKLSEGCINKIIKLRAEGREPFFLKDGIGRKIKIRKRLRPIQHLIPLYPQSQSQSQLPPISEQEMAELMTALRPRERVELPKWNNDPGTAESIGFAFVNDPPKSQTPLVVIQ